MATLTVTKEPERKELQVPRFDLDRAFFTNPFGMMRRFSEEMDRLFDDFGFKPRTFDRPLETAIWSPEVEVIERKGQLLVRADLPGLAKEDVKVNVIDDVLTIEGERKTEKETKDDGYFRTERSYGSFYRSIPLPEGTKTDQVKATFTNGVLEVALPLVKEEKKTTPVVIK